MERLINNNCNQEEGCVLINILFCFNWFIEEKHFLHTPHLPETTREKNNFAVNFCPHCGANIQGIKIFSNKYNFEKIAEDK